MATGQITATGAVSYLGELFQSSKRPNALLRLLGGLQGGIMRTTAREFPIGTFYSLRAPSQPARLEGAPAPQAEFRTLTQTTNVVQIFQEKVSLSYLAQSDKTVSGVIPLPQGPMNGPVQNPRSEAFQVAAALDTIAQDANYSFLRGSYVNPANPAAAALQTRGLHTAIVTNALDHSGDAALTTTTYRALVELLIQTIIQTAGFNPDDTWTIIAGTTEFANIQAAYESKTTPPYDREVGGLKLRQIYTRFGILNLVLEPDMPAQYFDICNLGLCGVVGLEVPGKGVLFEEPLYKQGSSDETQIYGQMGIDHGPEYLHGSMKVVAATSL